MKPLVEIDKEMDLGITPSVDLNDVLFWENGGNIAFKRHALTPMLPHIQGFPKEETTPIRGMFECIIDGEENIFYGTQRHLYRWTKDLGLVDVTRSPGGNYNGVINSQTQTHLVFGNETLILATVWQFALWGRWVVATNGRDVPQLFIPEDGLFRTLDTDNGANSTFQTCQLMMPFKSFMFALNTTPTVSAGNGGESFAHFSELDDIEKWDPLNPANKYAGDLPIRDADGPIMAGLVTDDALVFVTNHAMHAITFIGAPDYFGHQKLVNGCGALSKQCFLAFGRTFYGAGMQGIWVSDGVQVEYIDEPFIHKYIYDDMNMLQANKCLLWHNVYEEMIEFHYPSKNSNEVDKAVGFNYLDKNWTLIDRSRTGATVNTVFSFGITATANGEVAFQSIGRALENTDTRGGMDAMPFEFTEVFEGLSIGYGDGGYGQGGYGGLAMVLK